jgi:hypothetical protein
MANRPTRSQLIAAHVFDAVTRHRIGWKAYADAVVCHYHAHTDVEDRVLEFHVATTAETVERAERYNTQTLRRMLSGENRLPADIEESLIAALPEEAAERLQSALLDRAGLLRVAKPAAGQGGDAQHLAPACELMRRTAAAVEKIAPMLADDNRIGPEDLRHMDAAQRALEGVMGACLTVNAQIVAARLNASRTAAAKAGNAKELH